MKKEKVILSKIMNHIKTNHPAKVEKLRVNIKATEYEDEEAKSYGIVFAMHIARGLNTTVTPPKILLSLGYHDYKEVKREVDNFFIDAVRYYKKIGIKLEVA
jgi:hypothetical protein